MTSRLLLDLTYGVLPISKRKTWRVKRRLLRDYARDWRYLNRILILSLFRRAGDTVPAFHTLISLYKIQSPRDREFPPKIFTVAICHESLSFSSARTNVRLLILWLLSTLF